MKYVSPSILPSRSANSIHVMNQCNSLAKKTGSVHLYFATSDDRINTESLGDFYGMKLNRNIVLHPIKIRLNRAVEIKIAFRALLDVLFSPGDLLISRNFYFSFVLSVLRVSHLHESHGLESKKLKKWMQKKIVHRNKVVVISKKLSQILSKEFNSKTVPFILHDAASEIRPITISRYIRDHKRFKIGYFGHLYKGRGIEIIRDLAESFPFIDFFVVGGDEDSVNTLRAESNPINMIVLGFVSNIEARSLMREVDILLMPYQRRVSIGLLNSDTSKWMSPLKMFEYMSSNRPIISSNLPVIKEVLTDKENALLVEPDSLQDWRDAVQLLYQTENLRSQLAENAYSDYLKFYTWDKRAEALIEYAS